MMEGPRVQQRRTELRPKRAATSRKQKDIQQAPQADPWIGGSEARCRVFIGLWKMSDWTLWRSQPPPKRMKSLLAACVPVL
jgi:hypothetical protein